MTHFEMVQKLVHHQGNPEAAALLAQELTADARFPAALAAAELTTAGRKARSLLDVAREPALAVLAASAPAGTVADEAWKVRYLGQEMAGLLADAVRRLVPRLDDRTPLPEGMRVCDVAYVLVTRFLREPAVPGYLQLPEKERNAVIQALRQSERFLEATGA
jgi:hypothetical protein